MKTDPKFRDSSLKTASRSHILIWLAVLLIFVAAISIFLGRYPRPGLISPAQIANDSLAQKLVLNLRIPRVLTALLLGASLAARPAVSFR